MGERQISETMNNTPESKAGHTDNSTESKERIHLTHTSGLEAPDDD